MKKIIRLFVLAFALTFATLTFASCQDNKQEKVAEQAIKLLLVEQDPVVESNFTVGGLVSYKGVSYQVTWSSNNECLTIGDRVSNKDENGAEIAAHYVVTATRPETGNVDVTLTATINAGEGDVASKDFTYTLYAVDVFDIAASYTFSKANKVAKEAFDLDSEWTYAGKKATITWTANNEAVTIADGKASFDVKEEISVVFTATFTYNGTSADFPYTVTLAPSENGPVVITSIADGQSYYMGVNQENLGKYLYFAGTTANKDYYMSTTETVTESTKVTVNAVEGGYVLSFVNAEGATKYLDIVGGSYVNLYIVDTKPTTPLVWNADFNTFTKDIDGTNYYMGTYNTYNTLSASKFDYISTSFPIHFYDLPLGPVAEFTAGTSYKWALNQESLGKTLYFAGTTANKDYYMSTTENASEAVDVTPVQVEGGYHLKFVNPEGATKYLDITASGTYVNLYIVDTPTGVFVWNAEHSTFTKDMDGTHYYIGTYNTYNTLSASKLSYISTSYPCHLYASGGSLPEAEEPTPEVTPEKTPEGNVSTTGGLVIADYATANAWTNSTLYDSIKYDENTTITCSATTPSSYGQNTGKYYESDVSWRIYQADTSTITITSTKTIASIVIEYISNKTGILTVETGNVETGVSTTVNAKTFSFGVGNTDSAVTNGQVRITKITIVYAE